MEDTLPPPAAESPAKPDRQVPPKKLGISLVLAVLLGVFLIQPGFGFPVWILVFFQLFFIPLRLFYGITIPNERWLHFGRVAIWLVTITSVFLVHHVREDKHRKYANEVVAKLEAYTAAHGKCAPRLDDVGLNTRDFHGRLGYGGYSCDKGKPFLFYMTSFNGFSRWYFDFKNRKWDYFSD